MYANKTIVNIRVAMLYFLWTEFLSKSHIIGLFDFITLFSKEIKLKSMVSTLLIKLCMVITNL